MATTLDYLISDVRVKVGDFIEPYRYIDTWILSALNLAAKQFLRYSKSKYEVSPYNVISRNPAMTFATDETSEGTIERKDEPILIVLAAINMLEGSLENSAWSTASWKDAEISYSNIEGGRMRTSNLQRLQNELNDLILAPTKRLATADKQSLPGYKGNQYEREGEL